jgi:GntR family transcriptional regulator
VDLKHKSQQIKEYIINQIKTKELDELDSIESENRLASRFQVSRMTARKAIDELVLTGFLFREQGRGTFVAKQTSQKYASSFLSLSEEAALKGLDIKNRVIDFYQDIPSLDVMHHLGIKRNRLVWYIKRLRMSENHPYAFEDAVYCSSVLKECTQEILENSIYKHLENDLGLAILLAHQEIESVIADEYLADMLEIKIGMPLIKITVVSQMRNGKIFEYTKTYYPADRFKITQTAFR